MFSRMKEFLNRHRRKFIISGIMIGSAVLVTRYAQRKLREWQERETREFLERTRRQQHFESTERTCNQTIFSLSPKVLEAISKNVNPEELVNQLRNGHPDRLALWEELKILAFTKVSVVVYAFAMLVVTLRVQLNLIGGYMFKDMSEQSTLTVSSDVQERYLSLIQHFMGKGMSDLCHLVQSKVQDVVGSISLKRKLSLNDTEQLFWALQAAIANEDADPAKNVGLYLIAADSVTSSAREKEILNRMVTETLDVLASEEVVSLTSSLVSQGFSQVVDRVSEYFVPNDSIRPVPSDGIEGRWAEPLPSSSNETVTSTTKQLKNGHINGFETFVHPNSIDIAMAKLIPIVNGLGHSNGQGEKPDPWIQQLLVDDRIKVLGANVYEAFSYNQSSALETR